MTFRLRVALAILLCASLPVLGRGSPKEHDPLDDALYDKFPEAPKTLDSKPGPTGILVLEASISKLGFKVTGAILERLHDGAKIRASCFDKDLVLFQNLEPGSYALRLIKFNQVMTGASTITLPNSGAPKVDVKAGSVQYLGVAKAKIRTLSNPSVEIEYNAAIESNAWTQFNQHYAASPWTDLVNERIVSLARDASTPTNQTPEKSHPHP